jgi:hypothetical protein
MRLDRTQPRLIGRPSPRIQRSLRLLLQPKHRLLGQALRTGDGRWARRGGAVESEPDAVERSPVIGWLAAKIGAGLRLALMVDAGPWCLGLFAFGKGKGVVVDIAV